MANIICELVGCHQYDFCHKSQLFIKTFALKKYHIKMGLNQVLL